MLCKLSSFLLFLLSSFSLNFFVLLFSFLLISERRDCEGEWDRERERERDQRDGEWELEGDQESLRERDRKRGSRRRRRSDPIFRWVSWVDTGDTISSETQRKITTHRARKLGGPSIVKPVTRRPIQSVAQGGPILHDQRP